MTLRTKKMFDKAYLDREDPSEFIKYLSYDIERELINKLMDILKDHKLFVVQMQEPEFIEDLPESWRHQCSYKQDLTCVEIVQCKNCKMHFPWCHKFRDELGGNGFCPYGVEVQKGEDNVQRSTKTDSRNV